MTKPKKPHVETSSNVDHSTDTTLPPQPAVDNTALQAPSRVKVFNKDTEESEWVEVGKT